MKIQINTEEKTIIFEESIQLGKLFEMIKKLFPENEWKKYTLEPKVIQGWHNPIIIDRYPISPLPWWNQPYYVSPMTNPTITCETLIDNSTMPKAGIYSVSINN